MPDFAALADQAESLYEQKFRKALEKSHVDLFVAIEPVSEEFFLGATMSEAIADARRAHPDRLPHVIRIGHPAAVHIGCSNGRNC